MAATGLISATAVPAWAQVVDPLASPDEPQEQPAQVGADQGTAAPDTPDLVVTGTMLRGIAPVGTDVISVSSEDITASGASNSNDLLAEIPQITNQFNTTPTAGADLANPINAPVLRNLGTSGGNTTLVLLNGHRIVGAGVIQTVPDPSAIPPGVVERVEVVPDGSSSIYGSDAIGGVINFITRRSFNGLQVNGKVGFGDHYTEADGNVTAGKDWGSGSIYASYAYAWHDNILNRDRDYISQDLTSRGGSDFRGTSCAPGTISANGTTYALPGLVPGTANYCDNAATANSTAADADLYPREVRHAVFVGMHQDLSSALEFNLDTFYQHRKTTTLSSALRGSAVTITDANPYFQSIAGETSQTVSFSYAPVFGPNYAGHTTVSSWGVTPSLTYDLGAWEVKLQGNYGQSDTTIRLPTLNAAAQQAALAGTTLDTALNPYDLSQTNPAVLAGIRDYENYSHADQDMGELSLVADGTLLQLPGGRARLAVGGSLHFDNSYAASFFRPISSDFNGQQLHSSRKIQSTFAELFVPVFGPDNATGGFQRLDLTASVRYDHYSDFGGTTNPKFGFTYEPLRGLSLRGTWGTSFQAPSLADTTGAVDTRAILFFGGISPIRAPGSPMSDLFRQTLVIAGGNPNLKPQKAETYSLGADLKPDFLPGFSASVTYYNVHFTDAISIAPFFSPALYTTDAYSSFYTINPTLAQARALLGRYRPDGYSSVDSLYENGASPYVIIDARRNNFGTVNTDGLDFFVSYNRRTSFGSVNTSVGGNYILNRDTAAFPGAPFSNDLNNTRRFTATGSLGASVGHINGRVRVSYSGGYPLVNVADQKRIDSFTTTDLFFSYDLRGGGIGEDLSFTLNVDNVFDTNPPFYNQSGGYGNGSTLGRVVSFGVNKKF